MSELPRRGAPFRVGERVAFFPVQVGPTSLWLAWEDAVIDAIDEDAETFQFHHVSEPATARHGQGLENIVHRSENYFAWRKAWEAEYARSQNEDAADRATESLRLRVLAEHPLLGRDPGEPT